MKNIKNKLKKLAEALIFASVLGLFIWVMAYFAIATYENLFMPVS
jgi:hypothetical protein